MNIILVIYIYIYFVLIIQYGYNRTINIESNDIPDEFIYRFEVNNSYIKGKSQNYTIQEYMKQNSTMQDYRAKCNIDDPDFCKGDVCVCMYESVIKPFIELPDQNNHIRKYILVPYANYYKDFMYEYNNNETVYISLKCSNDYQCFSNKCVDNICTYNENSDATRCDRIYTRYNMFSRKKDIGGHIHCGRMLHEYCTEDEECSFNSCKNNRCSDIHYVPTELDSVVIDFQDIFIMIGFIIVIIIFLCCCCYYGIKCYKNRNENFTKIN